MRYNYQTKVAHKTPEIKREFGARKTGQNNNRSALLGQQIRLFFSLLFILLVHIVVLSNAVMPCKLGYVD